MEKHVLTEILLEGLECYNNTQMKACDITKLTVKQKNSDNKRYRNKIITLLVVFVSVAIQYTTYPHIR